MAGSHRLPALAGRLRLGVAKASGGRRARKHQADRNKQAIERKTDHRRGQGGAKWRGQRGCGAGTCLVTIWPRTGSRTVTVIAGFLRLPGVECPANARIRDGFRALFGCG